MTKKEKQKVWNEAIEAAVRHLKQNFVTPEVVIELIRQVKQ